MITLKADEAMAAVLRRATEVAEIRTAHGQLIGYFSPAREEDGYAKAMPQIDPAEIDRRKNEPGPRYTTRQVFEHLLSLTKDEPSRSPAGAGKRNSAVPKTRVDRQSFRATRVALPFYSVLQG